MSLPFLVAVLSLTAGIRLPCHAFHYRGSRIFTSDRNACSGFLASKSNQNCDRQYDKSIALDWLVGRVRRRCGQLQHAAAHEARIDISLSFRWSLPSALRALDLENRSSCAPSTRSTQLLRGE